MTQGRWLTFAFFGSMLGAAFVLAQQPTAPSRAFVATSNPQLVGALARELGATPKQAEGAAGTLLSTAKSRLSADEWSRVADAVPGSDGLLKAAAATPAGAAGALPGDMVEKALPVLTEYVTKTRGADVGQLLAGALK